MSHADAAIGMMDGAYFTSRNDILAFFNSILDLNLTKIEQTASGAVACQLTEYIFPNSVPMSRVNWAAKSSHEYIDNYKLLQKAFTKYKVQRYVDVDKLIRAKYQDNLEFCQWLKAFFDQTAPMMRGGREGYDPAAVRAKGKGGKAVATNKGGVKKSSASARPGAASARAVVKTGGGGRIASTGASRPVRSTASTSNSRPTSESSPSSRVSASKENNTNSRPPSQPRKVVGASSSAASSAKAAKYEQENRALKSENTSLKSETTTLESENTRLKSENTSLKSKYSELEHTSTEVELSLHTVESERDFYFEKLRGMEVMLQVYKEKEEEEQGNGDVNNVMENMFKVMYATMEDDVVVDDEGNLVGDVNVDSSIDKSALLSVKAQDDLGEEDLGEEDLGEEDLGEEDEELLTSVIKSMAEASPSAIETTVPPNQFCSDSSDLDDDELLTLGLDDEPVTNVGESGSKIDEASEFKERFPIVHDDDDFSDEDLLAD